MITYKDVSPKLFTKIAVLLDGKTVGHIFKHLPTQMFYYQPKGKKQQGELFCTLERCKASLQ